MTLCEDKMGHGVQVNYGFESLCSVFHFLLTGPLLGRNRVSQAVGVLGGDSHQVVCS